LLIDIIQIIVIILEASLYGPIAKLIKIDCSTLVLIDFLKSHFKWLDFASPFLYHWRGKFELWEWELFVVVVINFQIGDVKFEILLQCQQQPPELMHLKILTILKPLRPCRSRSIIKRFHDCRFPSPVPFHQWGLSQNVPNALPHLQNRKKSIPIIVDFPKKFLSFLLLILISRQGVQNFYRLSMFASGFLKPLKSFSFFSGKFVLVVIGKIPVEKWPLYGPFTEFFKVDFSWTIGIDLIENRG